MYYTETRLKDPIKEKKWRLEINPDLIIKQILEATLNTQNK